MRILLYILLLDLVFVRSVEAAQRTKDEAEIAALTKQLVEVATPNAGVGKNIQEISEKFADFDHTMVVEALLPLLKHDKDGVPDKASYIILDYKDGLRPDHLDQLKKGFRNGGGWLPNAIAALDTDGAAEFLAKEFRADPEIYEQLGWALVSMGERGVPFLLKEFDGTDPEREQRFFSGLRHLFKGDHLHDGLKEKAKIAIPHLMRIAESKDENLRRRQEAIKTVGCVGKASMSFFPRLKVLAQQEPDKFGEAVTQAIVSSETSLAAEVLANKVDAGAGHYTIREIALLGTEAKNVGPRVFRWLNDPNWETRIMAARTLGAIGYKDARKSVQELLSSKADWRLAYVATKSLADLQATESIPALEEASRKHWFPIVRHAAKDALRSLQYGDELEGHGGTAAGDLMDFVFVDRDELSIEDDDLKGLKPRKRGAGERTSFGAFQQRQPALAQKFIEIRNTNGEWMLKDSGSIIEFPIDGGLLLGAAAGEWVGGLHYAPKDGEHRRLLHKNVSGIEKWKGRIFVASGTNHMGMNEGIIHEVSIEDGKVALVPWFVLPGLPTSMWVTEDEKLIVACVGGTLAFSGKGEFRYFGSKPTKQNGTKQDGADQPANALDSKPEGDSKPKPEAKQRSQ